MCGQWKTQLQLSSNQWTASYNVIQPMNSGVTMLSSQWTTLLQVIQTMNNAEYNLSSSQWTTVFQCYPANEQRYYMSSNQWTTPLQLESSQWATSYNCNSTNEQRRYNCNPPNKTLVNIIYISKLQFILMKNIFIIISGNQWQRADNPSLNVNDVLQSQPSSAEQSGQRTQTISQ